MEKPWGFLVYSSAIYACFCTVHFFMTLKKNSIWMQIDLKSTLGTSAAAS